MSIIEKDVEKVVYGEKWKKREKERKRNLKMREIEKKRGRLKYIY